MAERKLPKLETGVRFPSSALLHLVRSASAPMRWSASLSCPEASGRIGSHRPRVVDPPHAMEELPHHPESWPPLGVTRMMSVTAVSPDAGRNRTLRPPHVHVRPMAPRSRAAG